MERLFVLVFSFVALLEIFIHCKCYSLVITSRIGFVKTVLTVVKEVFGHEYRKASWLAPNCMPTWEIIKASLVSRFDAFLFVYSCRAKYIRSPLKIISWWYPKDWLAVSCFQPYLKFCECLAKGLGMCQNYENVTLFFVLNLGKNPS